MTGRLKLSVLFILFLIVVYSTMRAGFYSFNHSYFVDISRKDILHSFYSGLRFDLAAILISNSLFLLLYNLPFSRIYRRNRNVFFILFPALNSFFIFLSISDFGYFNNTSRRLTYEPIKITGDIITFLPSLVQNHLGLAILSLLSITVFILISVKLFRFFDKKISPNEKISANIISSVIIILISVVTIRGGIQLKPLRPADAFFSDNNTVGYLTLNTTYSVILSSFQDDIGDYSFMPADDAAEICRDLFEDRCDTQINSEFVFMKKHECPDSTAKKNIVIFVMEGWSALYCGSVSGNKTFTPFFDSLASSGLLFTNFVASGQRSVESLPSILTSIPSVFNSSIINSDVEINHFRGIGSILKESGYSTSFHHGAKTGSMGFVGFAGIAGFNRYYGMEDFTDSSGKAYDGVWGIYDEPFFIESALRLNNIEKPFCSIIYSLSSHDPFQIPEDRRNLFNEYKNESDADISVRYSDYSLRKFFEIASKEDWFQNTIFLITADHTFYVSRHDFYSQFHIPLLIYSPIQNTRGTNNKISSHADIIPTIIDLLNLNTTHSSMGISLLSGKQERFSFEKAGNDYCILTDSLVLMNDFEKPFRLYNYVRDPEAKVNISDVYTVISEDLNKKLEAFLQVSSYSLKNDKLYFRQQN